MKPKHDLGKLRLAQNRSYLRSRRMARHQHITINYAPEATGQTVSWWPSYGAKDQRDGFTAVADIHRKPETRQHYMKPVDCTW